MGKQHRYGVILDAGSSGTRVYVYRWVDVHDVRKKGHSVELDSLPKIKMVKEKKVHPGVSTYGDAPEKVGDGLEELVRFAIKHVPESQVEDTPIFLLATAGMRLLPQHQREAVLQNICTYFERYTNFLLPDCALHVKVIPGETEGLYGWIAANYLLGGFDQPQSHDHGKDHHTYGFLDMGGASAQIAFAPNATEAEKHANDLKLLRLRRVNGEPIDYRVFVTTWLGFGANEARRRYVEDLLESYSSQTDLPDPCLPAGLTINMTSDAVGDGHPPASNAPHLVGTGNFVECLRRTNPLLGKDKPCLDSPCLLNGVHTPAIDFDVNHFVGVSEYWHTTHEIFAMAHEDKAYDFATYQKQVTDFCSRDWMSISKDVADRKWGKKVDEKTVEEVCFKASWLISMLHDGIGVPRQGLEVIEPPKAGHNKTTEMLDKAKDRGFLQPFQAVDEIDGKEVSWTLGKMVLYASSQIPPRSETDTLEVGFGTNQPGQHTPPDFERPGGSWSPTPSKAKLDGQSDWHDRVFSADYSRRVPGILILLLILSLAIWLSCGRERRATLQHKFATLLGRKPKPGASRSKRRKGPPGFLASTLFAGSQDASYERVLEEVDRDDVELGDIHSSLVSSPGGSSVGGLDHRQADAFSLDRPRTGRTSGLATPANRGLSPDFTRTSPKNKGYFDYASGHPFNGTAGLGITPFERGGLNARTESKERLALAPRDTRSRSRVGSPTRRSPLLTPLAVKESID